MGKTMNRLQKQLKESEHKTDAEECIEVYEWLKSVRDGRVWSLEWNVLVDVKFKGYPSNIRTYKLNIIGKTLLKGIR